MELIRAAPERMLYATNWPHPSLKNNLPDDAALLDLLNDWAGSEAVRKKILVDNPVEALRFLNVFTPEQPAGCQASVSA